MKKSNSKKYRFFYHFNKPMTKKSGYVHWSIHFRNKCYIVRSIECNVNTQTKENKTQPLGVVIGFASNILVNKDKATIL